MTSLVDISSPEVDAHSLADHRAYLEAVTRAQVRAAHSYFDQHVIREEDGSYWVADEGSYEPLMEGLVDRIVHSVPAGMFDE